MVVASWLAAMGKTTALFLARGLRRVPGWVCSLLIVIALFSIRHRINSVGPDSVSLVANNATSAR